MKRWARRTRPLKGRRDFKIVCCVSHTHEKTLGLALDSLDAQTQKTAKRRVSSRITPWTDSLNTCLDFAAEEDADFLFHASSAVVATPSALEHLLDRMSDEETFLAVGRGFSTFWGAGSAIGLRLFNMRIIGREFRFHDVPATELDFCDRVQQVAGKGFVYVGDGSRSLGYEHPIWTPIEMYTALRAAGQESEIETLHMLQTFLENELSFNPANKTLLAGQLGLAHAEENGQIDCLAEEFARATRHLSLDGSEYYVQHLKFKRLAQRLLGTYQDCVTVDER
jgi:hypothetical protein